MTETSGQGAPATGDRPTIRCQQCGQDVPALSTCVRCGDPLADELRKGRTGRVRDGFAANPDERAMAVRLVSTLYPALPREEIRTFQSALLLGGALVVVLAALGFFPVAVVAAAVLVPLITVIYLYDVDTYEDQPVRIVGLTFLWGAVAGALFAFVLDQVMPIQATSGVGGSAVGSVDPGFDWGRGVVAPLIAGVLMAVGPMLLLTQKRFNDVLDGATFGVASAVAFVGAQTIVTSIDLFRSGLQPGGDVVPWIVRLVGQGVAVPVIAAGAIGGFVGVLWLRYRGPDEHEDMLGPLGHPLVAAIIAAVLLVAAAVVEVLLREDIIAQLVQLAILVGLAVVAIVWLRRIIHLGLLQESLEIPIGPDIACANCGRATPSHSFCGECGVSLRALPKARGRDAGLAGASAVAGGVASPHEVRPTTPPEMPAGAAGAAVAAAGGPAVSRGPSAPRPASHGGLGPRLLLVVFGVLLATVTIVAIVIAYVVSQGLDQPRCDPDLPCPGVAVVAPVDAAAATRNDAPFPPLAHYEDPGTGFSFQYDPAIWSIAQQDNGFVLLSAYDGALAYIVEATSVDSLDVDELFHARRRLLEQRLLGFAEDAAPARRLIGNAILGHRIGIGALYGGTIDSPQGPGTDFAIALVASRDDRIVAVTTILTPAQARDFGLQLADSINNSFTWPTDPVVQ